jgi:hypothetical protein
MRSLRWSQALRHLSGWPRIAQVYLTSRCSARLAATVPQGDDSLGRHMCIVCSLIRRSSRAGQHAQQISAYQAAWVISMGQAQASIDLVAGYSPGRLCSAWQSSA